MRPFRECASFEVTPAFLRVDLAGIDLKFDAAGRRGKGGADGFVHVPILHRRRCGFDVSAQRFCGNVNPEEFFEGISAAPKGFRGDAGGGKAQHAWGEKPIESEFFIDVIAIELAARTTEEATFQGDMASTAQGADGVRAFVFAGVSTRTGPERGPFFSALSMNS